jgi:hypothetical protein
MTSHWRRIDYPKALVEPVILDDGRRVRLAGAFYVPRQDHGHEVHWVYESKLRVGSAELWCDTRNYFGSSWGHAEDVSADLAGGSPCEVCAGLALLPERGPES